MLEANLRRLTLSELLPVYATIADESFCTSRKNPGTNISTECGAELRLPPKPNSDPFSVTSYPEVIGRDTTVSNGPVSRLFGPERCRDSSGF